MKNLLLATLTALSVSIFAKASHHEVRSFDQIPWQTFTSKDLVGFDLDDTTHIETRLIMRNMNFDARKEFISEIRKIAGDERVSFTYDNNQYQLMENSILNYINDLKTRNISTVGFTARRTGKAEKIQRRSVADISLGILDSLGVQFFSSKIKNIEFEGMNTGNEDYKGFIANDRLRPFEVHGNVMVKNHVIFANNIDKGLVLDKIFSSSNFFPERFILIDDKKKNLNSVANIIEKLNQEYSLNIEFIGYWYTGSHHLDDAPNPDVVEIQRKYLLNDENTIFLTDEEALDIFESEKKKS